MDTGSYQSFLLVVGALSKLVVVAMLLERGLAVVFEHEWFIRLTTKEVPDPSDNKKTVRISRIPGVKGLVALGAAYAVCNKYDFDILYIVMAGANPVTVDPLGVALTSFVVAGGSAGAILLFQGYLNFGKQARDAIVEARKLSAEKAKAEAVV